MSNFVFSRRAMQQAIDRLAGALEIEQIKSIVGRLNRMGDNRLAAMWELMFLDALSSSVEMKHEVMLESGRRPDFELTSASLGNVNIIVGDITTISDVSLHEQNPVKTLSSEINRAARKLGLSPGCISYDVRGGLDGRSGDGRMSLFLPAKSEIPKFVKDLIYPWLLRLAADPDSSDTFSYAEGRTKLTLSYHPKSLGGGGGHTSYDVAASRRKNPLFLALKGKKDQLRAAPSNAIRLVIVCDGDCSLLRRGGARASSPYTFTAMQVATDFLRQNSSIDAVLLVTIEEQRTLFSSKVNCVLKCDLAVADKKDRSERMTDGAIDLIVEIINRALSAMPQPRRSAYAAAALCVSSKYGSDRIGGTTVKGDDITISSRALLRLLSGEISSEDFIAAHGWNATEHPNPFTQRHRLGQLIASVDIRDGGDTDDDLVRFSFGFPDAAASAFRIPISKKNDC